MAALCGLRHVKRFTYRGDTLEEFSNTFHFKGPPPGDVASWDVLSSDLWILERTIYPAEVVLVAAYGYDSDDPAAHHVYAKDYTLPGPPPAGARVRTSSHHFAGDQAACVEWKMDRLSKKGKPIFLRKYVHAGEMAATDPDQLDNDFVTALDSFATQVNNLHGGLRTGPRVALDPIPADSVVSHHVIPYSTTRSLKRRGKRPRTGN